MDPHRRYWLMLVGLLAATMLLHLVSYSESVPPSRSLEKFPMLLGSWHGREVSIDEEMVKALNVDDYLNRTYTDPASPATPIFLYVGYYRSQRTEEGIHSPKNCLPGSGWEPLTNTRLQLPLPNGGAAPVNLYVIQKGLDRELVVYWYQSNGRIIASEYSAKFHLALDAARYHRTDAALVRVVTPIRQDTQTAYDRVTAFAEQTVVPLKSILPR